MDSRRVQCRFCPCEFEQQYLEVHLKQNHRYHPEFQITCGINGCPEVYKNLNSLRSHRSRRHFHSRDAERNNEIDIAESGDVESSESGMDVDNEANNSNDNADDDFDLNANEDNEYNDDESSDSNDVSDEDEREDHVDVDLNEPNLQKITLGLMFLSMRAQCQVTNDVVLNVAKSLDAIVKRYVLDSFLKVEEILRENNICSLNELIDINREVASVDTVHGLNTIYKQDSYFKEQFDVIQPSIRELSSQFQQVGQQVADGNQTIKIKKDEIVYISIHDVLLKYLSKNTFRELLEQSFDSKEGILSSFKDGLMYKQHPMFSSNSKAVQIKLYYDEVELCDGLGSKAGARQKLGFVYSQYGNLPPMHQAAWSSINLVAIIRYPHVKKYGLAPLAEMIVDDIKKIENGIELPNGDIVYGTVSALTGDNLATHMFCGFKESFTAEHPCRFCMASYKEMQIMIREDTQLLRKKEKHDEQVKEIETAATDEEKAELSKDYGINKSCPLNKLIGFHAVTSTPPDIPHDFMGGMIPLNTKLLLYQFCVKKNWMTLDEFNQRVAEFDYGYSEKSSKPSPIKPEHLKGSKKIKQTMSQAWTLAVILPFIVHDRINDENVAYLENFIQLLEIMAIVCSHFISLESLSLLESLIPLYLETFAQLYKADGSPSGRKFIPKQHFLLHYPRLIAMFGPLIHFWTLRFEGKHQYFKKIVQAMRNWKNLPLTLARKHQLWQSLEWILSQTDEITTGPKKLVATSKLPFSQLFSEEDTLLTVSWVQLNHIKYTANQCFISVGYENGLPLFAELHKIVWKNENPIFVCKSVQTIQHDMNLMAYEIITSEIFTLHTPNSIVSHNVLHCHKLEKKKYIIVKQLWFDLH